MTGLNAALQKAQEENKCAFFFDQTENAFTFFKYKGCLIEVNVETTKLAMETTTVDEVKEAL